MLALISLDLFKSPSEKYSSGEACEVLLFEDCTMAEFDYQCRLVEESGYSLYSVNELGGNCFKTYTALDKIAQIHIYYCESEKKIRIVADSNSNLFVKSAENCPRTHQTALWQFEVDHSLIDCGMCYFVRCCDGSFFVVDSAHFYSMHDDERIIEILTRINGGKKPIVAGWFFSHAHSDHVAKFLDIVEYHRNEIEIQKVFYNFPTLAHRDSGHWEVSENSFLTKFERILSENPDIEHINIHSGQRFFVRNLEFVVLCTHEDIYPNSLANFNNSSSSLMMSVDGSKVLFPGDSSDESDKVLVPRWGDYLKCDVVQVSHHGHSGTSARFYELAAAECALFPITVIKYDEEFPLQEANRVAASIAGEYHIASNGTVEIPLPYKFGQTKIYPDETFEDFNGIYNLWTYEYTDERKQQLYNEFLKRSKC